VTADQTNPDLAAWFTAAARGLADHSRGRSLARKAALCCAVALQTTATLTGARRALAEVRPDDVRVAAVRLFPAGGLVTAALER
jgi:hypothetical protein